MPDNPIALSPNYQPTVNQLTDACRQISQIGTPLNVHTQAYALSQNIQQIFSFSLATHILQNTWIDHDNRSRTSPNAQLRSRQKPDGN